MQRKIMLLTVAMLATLGVSTAALAALPGYGPKMGSPTTISRQAFHGYYDGHRDTYLNTDVSDKKEAAARRTSRSRCRRRRSSTDR